MNMYEALFYLFAKLTDARQDNNKTKIINLILYYDQQMQNYFTNYHTPTCFDTIVSTSGSL